MEPLHPTTTSGSSEPHAPSYETADAQRASEGPAGEDEQQKPLASEKEAANIRESHDELSGLSDENLAEYTSLLVAVMRAAESKRDDAVMNDPYAELLAGDAGGAFLQMFSKWSPRMDTMSDFVALRTRSIDEALVHRHASIQQIVILGAGLDSRAYRMKSLADCLVIEVDTSASMMERKQKLLDDAGATVLAKQHHVIIADLEQDLWATELIANGFNPKAPTFWLLEGLLYYLSEDSNVRLVKTIDALSAKHSQLWADIGGFALVKGGDSEGEGLFRARALKYGENDPTNGVLSLLKWSMEIQLSMNEKQELYGREWQPMKVPSSKTGEEEVVPWFFVKISKTQEHPSEKPLF